MTESAAPFDADDLRSYRTRWERVGPALEKLRRRELRRMMEEEHRQALADVMELARHRICGLAEFYRRWRKP